MLILDRMPALAAVPIIGIVRGCPPERVVDVVGVAVEGGLGVVEITLDSPRALGQIEAVVAAREVVVGAGTVTRASQVAEVVAAGAAFVVSPVIVPEIIDACAEHDVVCIPGAATPSEIFGAWEHGAAAVKVFPAAPLGGPSYLDAIRRPLGGIPLIPTGGVHRDDAGAYLAAGAVALGVGGDLFSAAAMASGDLSSIADRARAWVRAVRR